MNFTNETIDFSSQQFYNTGCIDELAKFSKLCIDFKVDVLANYNLRFKITVILLIIFVSFRLYTKYSRPLFTEHKFWLEYADSRLDFIIAILMIFTIAFMFF